MGVGSQSRASGVGEVPSGGSDTLSERMFVAAPDKIAPRDAVEDLPLEQLEHEIELRAARANADMCTWLELIAEFDRRGGWGTWGCLSCAHWVAWRCSVSQRSAREHVRVARRLAELPSIHAEFAAGRISYSKVRALSRVATEESEPDLLQLAANATASQLDHLVRAYSRASAVAAGEIHRNRYVTWFWEDDGSLSLHANLPAEDGATVVAAIEAAAERVREGKEEWQVAVEQAEARNAQRDHGDGLASAEGSGSAEPLRPEEGGSAEPPRGPVSRAEAFVAMATDSMTGGGGGSKPADRNMVVVHVDADELAVDGQGRCHIRDGAGLPAETARRIACDSSVVTLLERGGEPLSVGRRTRSIPSPMRRAVEARDQGCRFPGCHNKRYTDVHHIHHWAAGGQTSAENLVTLCRRHHRLVHEGGYSIKREDGIGELVFRRPDRTTLTASPPPPPIDGCTVPRSPRELGPLRVGSGEKMDLDYAVLAMIQICEPRDRAGPTPPA